MRYGFQQMDFTQWLELADASIAKIEQLDQRNKILEQSLSAKDIELQQKNDLIVDLQEQLTTASTALFADANQLTQLQNKFNQLSSLVTPLEEKK